MSSFFGQKVLVVGGTSGVGLATARAFDAEGAEVVVASRSRNKLDAALGRLGAKASAIELDVRNDDVMDAFATNGHMWDHVVMTAGETPTGPSRVLPMKDAYSALDSKFWGSYRVARSVTVKSGGSLTLLAGYLSIRPNKASPLQSAINAAVEALGRALALEYAPVRVNTISPGLLDTPLWDHLSTEKREAMYEAARARLPVGRVGQPEDVAEAVVYLARSQHATGTVLYVDGGGSIA